MTEKYERIILRPHYVSKSRSRMADVDRAAQFAPYVALSGFEDEVNEEARITEKRRFLDESEIERIDEKFRMLSALGEEYERRVTYFVNDNKKSGGAYHDKIGRVRKIDSCTGRIIFTDGTNIPINTVTDIEIL